MRIAVPISLSIINLFLAEIEGAKNKIKFPRKTLTKKTGSPLNSSSTLFYFRSDNSDSSSQSSSSRSDSDHAPCDGKVETETDGECFSDEKEASYAAKENSKNANNIDDPHDDFDREPYPYFTRSEPGRYVDVGGSDCNKQYSRPMLVENPSKNSSIPRSASADSVAYQRKHTCNCQYFTDELGKNYHPRYPQFRNKYARPPGKRNHVRNALRKPLQKTQSEADIKNKNQSKGLKPSLGLPFTDLEPAVGYIISDDETQDSKRTGRKLLTINIEDIDNESCTVSPGRTPVNTLENDFATPTGTVTIESPSIEPRLIESFEVTLENDIGLPLDDNESFQTNVNNETSDTLIIGAPPNIADTPSNTADMTFTELPNPNYAEAGIFEIESAMYNSPQESEPPEGIQSSAVSTVDELPIINDGPNIAPPDPGPSLGITTGSNFSVSNTNSNDVTDVTDNDEIASVDKDETTSEDDTDCTTTSTTEDVKIPAKIDNEDVALPNDKTNTSTLVDDNSNPVKENIGIFTPTIIDAVTGKSTGPQLTATAAIDEEEEDEDEYIEDPVEIENMRSTLQKTQQVLLFLAAATFLSILVYSIYYINLIRKIYARTRIAK